MRPWDLLGRADAPDGTALTLMRRDRETVIFANGKILMSSRMHGSEEALAEFGLAGARQGRAPRVLVGGLGLGYTLRAALDLLPADARVIVAELIPAVVAWHAGPLGPLAAYPLRDPRVTLVTGDVLGVIEGETSRVDAILLDVDNGPDAFTTAGNAGLYGDRGLAAAHRALVPDGVLAVWSAWEDRKFEQRLRYQGFGVEVRRVRARLKQGGPRHTIFLARRGEAPARIRSTTAQGTGPTAPRRGPVPATAATHGRRERRSRR